MNQNQKKLLSRCLAYTNIDQLGEGDAKAGTNLLACTACTIANLAPPGSGIVSPDGMKTQVGASMVVNGSLSSSLIRDVVCSPITEMQNNLTSHIRRSLEELEKQKANPGTKAFVIQYGPKASASENTFLSLHQSEPLLWGSPEEAWAEILANPPTPKLMDLIKSPKVVVTATDAHDLKKQLIGLHRKRPMVIMGLGTKSGSPQLAETCTALMDGTLSDGKGAETINGNMLVLDSENRLAELANSSRNNEIRWLGNMIWLVDGDAGPDAEPRPQENTKPLDQMPARINIALHHAMGNRLRNDQTCPTDYKKDFSGAQMRWVQFLQGMNGSLPGITGSARQLLATLVFGIHAITHVRGFKMVDIHISYIENFARHLILRMANARNTIYADAEAEHRVRLKRAILVKLQDGGLVPRDIYRALGIRSELCHDIMRELATTNYIQKSGNKWILTQRGMIFLGGAAVTRLEI